jgi:hypothetical protein
MQITKKDVQKVLQEYPTLNYSGFGLFESGKALSSKEKLVELQKQQEELCSALKEIQHTYDWLDDVQQIKSINTKIGSYGLKHDAEKSALSGYISNGCFIAGAILKGFKVQINEPNAYFNMSNKDLNRKRNP